MMEPKFLVVKLTNEVIVTSLELFYLQYLFHFLQEAIDLIRVEVSELFNKMENCNASLHILVLLKRLQGTEKTIITYGSHTLKKFKFET